MDSAAERFKELVLPEMHKQESTPEGKGLVMSLWAGQEAAVATVESGFYNEQIAKFISVFRAPQGVSTTRWSSPTLRGSVKADFFLSI